MQVFFVRLFIFCTFFAALSGNNISYAKVDCKQPICKAVYIGNTQQVDKLLKKNKKLLNFKLPHNVTLLHLAVLNQDFNMTQFLLQKGINPNIKDDGGASALHIAARGNLDRIANLLLDRGADINIQDVEGFTPIMRAVLLGRSKMVDLLLQRNPDCRLKNDYNEDLAGIETKKLSEETARNLRLYIGRCRAN